MPFERLKDDEYVYAIAGGETLEEVSPLLREAAEARTELEEIAGRAGLKIAFTEASAHFNSPTGHPPEGWEWDHGCFGDTDFVPRDSALANRVEQLQGKLAVSHHFNNAFNDRQFREDDKGNPSFLPWDTQQMYKVEPVGDTVFIKCPPMVNMQSRREEQETAPPLYIIPAGCTEVAHSEYVRAREETLPRPARDVRVLASKP